MVALFAPGAQPDENGHGLIDEKVAQGVGVPTAVTDQFTATADFEGTTLLTHVAVDATSTSTVAGMEASIGEIARATGTTSRTLRHYAAVGLLTPSRTGPGGVRWYDADALVRLQRILLLRDLGLPLAQIARVLDAQADETDALRAHLVWLRAERARLDRMVATVERTITARERGTTMTAPQMFDGFDHTQHREEVERRWGADAYATSDAWWRGQSDEQRAAWQADAQQLVADWVQAAADQVDPASPRAQALAARQVAWLGAIPGTPGTATEPSVPYVLGLGDLYVTDPRFAATYGGQGGAELVRDALRVWASRLPGVSTAER